MTDSTGPVDADRAARWGDIYRDIGFKDHGPGDTRSRCMTMVAAYSALALRKRYRGDWAGEALALDTARYYLDIVQCETAAESSQGAARPTDERVVRHGAGHAEGSQP